MSEQLDRFISLLKGIFELDKSDLDFGIYRIMNIRKKEIEKFLAEGLPARVKDALAPFAGNTSDIEKRIAEIEKQCDTVGIEVANSKMAVEYNELKATLEKGVDLSGLEADVYSQLYSFFNRYYEEGDFISKRRYKESVYAIPYEGEEVKLYWANQDQYYIKTSENFKDYTFVADGYNIHFRLVDATTEQNNNKESKDNKRVFMLYTEDPERPELKTFEFDAKKKEFIIRFVFDIPEDKKAKYEELNDKAITTWLIGNCQELVTVLLVNISSDPKKQQNLLQKHLRSYVAKNTFDYFIHKDLKKFLSRELDFFIKNEVMHLDDVDTTDEKRVDTWLAKVRAIKRVGHVIIDFLASIEDFQKKLWLKKKFVVQCDYCITLDRIPERFYKEIWSNEAQLREWQSLGFISDLHHDYGFWEFTFNDKEHQISHDSDGNVIIKTDFAAKKVGTLFDNSPLPQIVDICDVFAYLLVDTKFFNQKFKDDLLSCFENVAEQCDGLLIHSENFQALNFLRLCYKEKVKCIYIDPPYNTGKDEDFYYKDRFRYSSWCQMINDRVSLAKFLLQPTGSAFFQIDDYEEHHLRILLDNIFGNDNRINRIAWIRTFNSGSSKGLSKKLPANIDTIYWYSINSQFEHNKELRPYSEGAMKRYDKQDAKGRFKWNPMKTYSEEKLKRLLASGDAMWTPDSKYPVYKKYLDENSGAPLDNNWNDISGMGTFSEERTGFVTQKPTKLLERCLNLTNADIALDFFAGSGTLAHAVINLNRQDGKKRKYIMIDVGEHFCSITKQRLPKVIFSEDWKNGLPVKIRSGISHFFKYMRLESYEDALSNVELPEDKSIERMVSLFGDEYLIKYMLDLDTAGSVLTLATFNDPFDYKLKVTEKNETKEVNADLMETFNYLIGLTVDKMYARKIFSASPDPAGEYEGAVKLTGNDNGEYIFRQIEGTLPSGERALIIWRNITDNLLESNAALDAYFQRYRINPADREYDVIYVNGDNNIANLKSTEETWKVRMIEPEFKSRMFEEK